MKKEYPPLSHLKKEFGNNKKIPKVYEEVILKALSHYPELKDTRINFKLKKNHPVPYGTSPALTGLLMNAKKGTYTISILEEAERPVKLALFKNLPEEAQRAVIGHELAHVLQFIDAKTPGLLKMALSYTKMFSKREIERGADIIAIEHGLGFELYVHAVYIRKIAGYVELRKNIETDYLKPQEILDTLPEGTPV